MNFSYLLRHYKLFRTCSLFRYLCLVVFYVLLQKNIECTCRFLHLQKALFASIIQKIKICMVFLTQNMYFFVYIMFYFVVLIIKKFKFIIFFSSDKAESAMWRYLKEEGNEKGEKHFTPPLSLDVFFPSFYFISLLEWRHMAIWALSTFINNKI